MITVNATMSQLIKIGHQGENKAVQVAFDLTPFQAAFQGGYPQLVVRRPGDQSGYPVALIVDGSQAIWIVSFSDTEKSGHGQCELQWFVGDALAKSDKYNYIVYGAIPSDAEPPDAPSKAWFEKILSDIGDLSDLDTESKENLVAAINEARQTGGGGSGGTSDHSKLINRNAADQHPIGAITGLEAALAGKQPAGSYLTDKDLDTTITMEGKAADAKAVGDALRSLSEEIVELDTTMTQSGKAADAKAVGDALAGKVDGIGITAIMAITQEDYDELVMLGEVSATTLYIITANAGGGDAEVTMVPYLVSDGVAYIDTGYKCTAEDVLELTYRDIGKPDDGTYIKAATPYCGGNAFSIGYAGSRYVQATHAGAYLGYKPTDLNAKATIKRGPTTLYYNGEIVGTATAGTKAETMSTLIFAQKVSDTSVSKCAHKVYFYGLKIWQGDSLVHYYKPAQDESGVACVYDAVTKEYFYNADTESALTYGEEVEGS